MERTPCEHLYDIACRELSEVMAQRDRLRAALVALIGVDGKAELEQMEAVMRLMPAAAEDKAASVDAIHALIATLPETPATNGSGLQAQDATTGKVDSAVAEKKTTDVLVASLSVEEKKEP
jgi:hypothetical protein